MFINPEYAEAGRKSGGRIGGSNFGGYRRSSYSYNSSRRNYNSGLRYIINKDIYYNKMLF